MKRLVLLFALILIINYVNAGERGTPEEAMALVQKVIASLKKSDRTRVFEDVNKGKYVDRDLFVAIIDSNGVTVAHSNNPRVIGKNLSSIRDIDGVYFHKEAEDLVKAKGKGWVNFRWPNPATGKIERKASYIEQFEDLAIACGVYKGD